MLTASVAGPTVVANRCLAVDAYWFHVTSFEALVLDATS